MKLPELALRNRTFTLFAVVLLVLAGIAAFFSLGQLEEPDFTIKVAVVSTPYPGATPIEVERDVTDRIETKLQELKQVDHLESSSQEGLSVVKVFIKPTYTSAQIAQVWDELRRKVGDVAPQLPQRAGPSAVSDDFGDVYGLLLALTGDGYTPAELKQYATDIRKELSLVPGVARVALWGVQDRRIYLDASLSQLTQLGISETNLERAITQQNAVAAAGSVALANQRVAVTPSGQFPTVDSIADLLVQASPLESFQQTGSAQRQSDLIRIGDVAKVDLGYRDPPLTLMRYNGQPAITIAITNQPGVNVVELGKRVDVRLAQLVADLPIGIDVHKVHWQSELIDSAVRSFFISLAEAVAIVLAVLWLAMGWRMGIVIGSSIILTILGTFVVMAGMGIDLQRMSLGALVIALGMMVDNSIVVAEGALVRMQRGGPREKAAIEAATQPAWPLLGATIVAVLAFYPIAASTENAGEYCASLFSVAAISLLLSWVLSVTVTPLQCVQLLRPAMVAGGGAQSGRLVRGFRILLETAIRRRFLTLMIAVGLLIVSVIGFSQVTKLFFPDSSMPKFLIDYRLAEGSRIEAVSTDMAGIEKKLLSDPRIAGVASFIGAGPPRFYLPVDPEPLSSNYGQFVVNVHDHRDVAPLIASLAPWLKETYPQATVLLRPFGVGPGLTWKFEARISGPASATGDSLRALAAKGTAILQASPLTDVAQTNWQQRVAKFQPQFNDARARWAGISRDDVVRGIRQSLDGWPLGVFNQEDEALPIVLRVRQDEGPGSDIGALRNVQIRPANGAETVPLDQVIDGVAIGWEDPVIWRRDRKRTITLQANPIRGVTLPTYMESVAPPLTALASTLPSGYQMEWGGEYETSTKSQASLIPGIVPAVGVMLLIIVGLFNAIRPAAIIMLTIPFSIVGMTVGLLVTRTPFGFVALLGAMSLAGMMVKNAIVLLDEVNANIAAGKTPYDAVIEAALSRLRPVFLAAATTVLGVIPLLPDVFWAGLAVTIMAGLTIGTIFTMIIVPVLYATLYRLPTRRPAQRDLRPLAQPAEIKTG
ncbi:efflux RND transporter permease subunit [Dongia soli]|uniref:Efflux RND transporter permease subunit n=1 Tax=Dongia soli TaxID=600628 RepID=A0ABU5EHN5_9PROT|nr:efflux RND transporter permease subunit [Dongia soli]MDY0884958.1 efflux RND transporter permease subunit [Dongia soli]